MIFDKSFQEWKAQTGGTIVQWRSLSSAAWESVRTSVHYHGGKSCFDAKCSRYPVAVN
jgi:hypothetical protein